MTLHYADDTVTLHHGDALAIARGLPDESVNSCITSPPYYGLRDYGEEGQYGLEATPGEYVETQRALFAEIRRVLADDGTLWLNIGDSYSSSTKGAGGGGKKSGLRRDGRPEDARLASAAATVSRQEMDVRRIEPGVPEKNLLGMPWRVAFALQGDGWILRNAIVWNKGNAMPESVTDRLACRYETLFLFSKSPRYWFDLDPIREPLIYPEAADGSRVFGGVNKAAALTTGSSSRRTGNRYGAARPGGNREQSADRDAADPRGRNPGDVWTINTQPFPEAHFAVMPATLAERCVLSGCKPGGTVLDPFSGSGTTGMVAQRHGRKYVGIDLSAKYLDMSLRTRLRQAALNFEGGAA